MSSECCEIYFDAVGPIFLSSLIGVYIIDLRDDALELPRILGTSIVFIIDFLKYSVASIWLPSPWIISFCILSILICSSVTYRFNLLRRNSTSGFACRLCKSSGSKLFWNASKWLALSKKSNRKLSFGSKTLSLMLCSSQMRMRSLTSSEIMSVTGTIRFTSSESSLPRLSISACCSKSATFGSCYVEAFKTCFATVCDDISLNSLFVVRNISLSLSTTSCYRGRFGLSIHLWRASLNNWTSSLREKLESKFFSDAKISSRFRWYSFSQILSSSRWGISTSWNSRTSTISWMNWVVRRLYWFKNSFWCSTFCSNWSRWTWIETDLRDGCCVSTAWFFVWITFLISTSSVWVKEGFVGIGGLTSSTFISVWVYWV